MPDTDTPATDVLMVAHGWPSDAEAAEVALAGIAARVQRFLPDLTLRSATMAKPGSLEAALTNLQPNSAIYPFFMTDGWFVNSALRKRVGEVRMLAPFGLEPALPTQAAAWIRNASQGTIDGTSRVLLAAHGSARGMAAANATEAFADKLRAALPGDTIDVAYVEQTPFINDCAPNLDDATLCLPFFAMEGGHVREDVTETLRQGGFGGSILPAMGVAPETPELIAKSLVQQMLR